MRVFTEQSFFFKGFLRRVSLFFFLEEGESSSSHSVSDSSLFLDVLILVSYPFDAEADKGLDRVDMFL